VDLVSIKQMHHPRAQDEIPPWREGQAWLAGGTWLFSEPQWSLDSLVELSGLDWPELVLSEDGLEIAATCPISVLGTFDTPTDWAAAPLFQLCSQSLLASFKVKNVATVGGNICMSLPAGSMTSLAVALEATYEIWRRDGTAKRVVATEFVIGDHANILSQGELLRAIHLPISALKKRFAFRRAALTQLGRSAALIIGTRGIGEPGFLLTITAATPRPIQILFESMPTAAELDEAIAEATAQDGYFSDPHGRADYKRHVTRAFAEQIRLELCVDASAA
jgi:CO/xanthine dehydrogenase FAD-binding subunit